MADWQVDDSSGLAEDASAPMVDDTSVRLPPTKCLYYPYIHFRSLDWLKYALLYWEGVKRIVPVHVRTQDPPEVTALVEKGLVENVAADEFLNQAADVFIPKLERLAASRGGSFTGGAQRAARDAKAADS